MLTLPAMRDALPPRFKSSATQEMVDVINGLGTNPHDAEAVADNFITYASIIGEGRHTLDQYLNAIKYVTYKNMNMTNEQAWAKVFPQRHSRLLAQGADGKTIAAHVSAFTSSKLVTKLLEQVFVPVWLLNQGMFQEALQVQASLMRNADSERVRMEAANSILTHLAQPKAATENNISIQIGGEDTSGMKELKAMMEDMARNQLEGLKDGSKTVKDITDVDFFEVREDEQDS